MPNLTLDALQALLQSIEKWEENTKITDIDDAMTGTGNCPLCQLFFSKSSKDCSRCHGCPVSAKTGNPCCYDTPYSDFGLEGDISLDDFLDGAKAELEFLKSLVPPCQE